MSVLQDLDWSVIQNAAWPAILQVIAFLILIVAIGIAQRRISLLAREMRQLSEEVKGLTLAEHKRLVQEIKLATQKTDKRKSVA